MKSLTSYFLASIILFGGLLLFTSCSEDDEVIPSAPGLSITGDGIDATTLTYEGFPGETMVVDITINAPAGFNVLRVTKTVDNTVEVDSEQLVAKAPGSTELTADYTFEYDLVASEIGKSIVFEFEAVDDANQVTTEEVTLVTKEPTVSIYAATLLNPPSPEKNSKTFFSSSEGKSYTVTEINNTANTSPKIDFGYYYGVNDKASLAAPSAYPSAIFNIQAENWNQYNATLFRTTNNFLKQDFESIGLGDASEIAAEFEVGTAEANIITDLAVDQIVAFKTAAGKFGLLLVTEIEPGNGSTSDYIKFIVKVQK